MPTTYEPISTTTFTGSTTTVTFSSIPNTYTDLRVIFAGGVPASDNAAYVRFNGDNGTNYNWYNLIGTGAAISSSIGGPSESLINAGTIVSNRSLITLDIFSYANTSKYKVALITGSADKNGSGTVERKSALWLSNSAITSITFYTSGSVNFTNGSCITLYGIKAA
jgi:hypothetical protein